MRLIRFVSRFTIYLCNAIYFSTTFNTSCKWFIKILHFVFWNLNRPQFQAILSLYQFQAIFLCQAGKTLSSDGPWQPRIVSLILFVFAAAARSISASLRPGAAAFECRGINAAWQAARATHIKVHRLQCWLPMPIKINHPEDHLTKARDRFDRERPPSAERFDLNSLV